MKISRILTDDYKTVTKPNDDDKQTQSSSTTVPMVEEKTENEIKKPDLNTDEITILETSHPINETYRNLQLLRAKTKNDDLSDEKTEKLKQIVKILEVLTHSAQDAEQDDALYFKTSQGFHGDISTKDKYEHDTTGNSYETNNSASLTLGTKNTNTSASFGCDIGINKDNDKSSPVVSGFNAETTNEDEEKDDDNPSGGDDIPIPVHERDIDSAQKYDITLAHNRVVNYKNQQYIIAGGGDFHLTDKSTMYSLRAAIQNKDGIRLSFDTTRTITDGQKIIDNRFRIRLIDNTTDKETPTEQNDETDEEKIPFDFVDVRTKNKLGLELIIDDNDFGAKGSYILFDNGKLDTFGNYNRSRFYVDASLVDDTSDDKDKFKFSSDVNYIYENARSNGNYTVAKAEAGFNTTVIHGSRPDHVVFGNLTLDAKRGRSMYEAGAHYIATRDMELGFAGIGYNYDAKKWSFGSNIDYVIGSMFHEKVNYLSLGLNAQYKF